MKILIIDDDSLFIDKLENDLYNHFSSIVDIIEFDRITNDFASPTFKSKYDLCFIDIDLNGDNGIELAKQIKTTGTCNTIVFITAHQHLVYDSLIVNPFFFIRKNKYHDDLKTLLEMISSSYTESEFISLKWNYEIKLIKIDDIIYIMAKDHYIMVYTMNGAYSDIRSMKAFLEEVNQIKFVQVHKSYSVNLDYLINYSSNEISMAGGLNLRIGRTYKDNFVEHYQEYLIK